jgi:large subunit ribosomal protein L24
MKFKKGDKVKVIAGKDKGKVGKLLRIYVAQNKATVEGINLAIKHIKPKRENEKGQKIEFPAPISISNLMLLCPKCNRSARIAYKILIKNKEKRNKVRICAKCKELID